MKALLITRNDLARQAANRWWLQYLSPHAGRRGDDGERLVMHMKLVSLGSNPTPEQVDAVMPNTSWTRLSCNACKEEVPRVVSVDVTSEEYTTHICEECVKKMMALFTP